TNVATTTNANGRYELQVPDGGTTLVYSNIGFIAVKHPIGSQNVLDVVLQTSVSDLEEVVVVGYGVQKKANLTGAVSTINFEGVMENRPITNASQALGGN